MKVAGSSSSGSIVSHPTASPFCRSSCDQAAASDVLPNPAGALIMASLFPESWETMSRSRGRGISPSHRGGTSLVARNSRCFLSRTAPLGEGGSPPEPVKAGCVNGASPSGLRPVPIRAITLPIPPYDSDGHRESNRAVLVFQFEVIRVECSADGTFHLLSVRGPLTKQFPRT